MPGPLPEIPGATGRPHADAAARSVPAPSRVGPGPLWAPLVPLYGTAVLARRWAFDHGLARIAAAGVPVVSVGGLEAGGSGKTPVTGVVLRALLATGLRPGLLTRGYGRPRTDLVVRRRGEPAPAAGIGDEPAMLVAGGLDVPVAACPDRAAGARALEGLGVDRLVLDDGFQHRRLGRDLDIVVLRGEAPFGSGHLLPWGTLREPSSSLRRAGVVWLRFGGEPGVEAASLISRIAPDADVVASRDEPGPVRDAGGAPVELAGQPVVAAAGIARPGDFARTVEALGGELRALVPLRDHHRYGPADVARLAALVTASRATALVVTAKDAVKLAPLWSGPALWVVGIRVRIVSGRERLAARLGVPPAALSAA